MNNLKNQLGNIQWHDSTGAIRLKDMDTNHLTNSALLCARKVKDFVEFNIEPCPYHDIYHREWLILLQAQRVITESNFNDDCDDADIWSPSLSQRLRVTLRDIKARKEDKLKAKAQAAADKAYKETMEAARTNYLYSDDSDYESMFGTYY